LHRARRSLADDEVGGKDEAAYVVRFRHAPERTMNISKALTIAIAMSLASSCPAEAQDPVSPTHPAAHHSQKVHHRIPAVRDQAREERAHRVPAVRDTSSSPVAPPVVVATPPAVPAQPFGLAFPHIAPYPDNKGDEDGTSEDENDCNKGCIDGNGAD
jgi:hypothetical protein